MTDTTHRTYHGRITGRSAGVGDAGTILYEAVAVGTPDVVRVGPMPPTVSRFLNVEIFAAPVGSPCTITVDAGAAGLYDVQESLPFDLCPVRQGGG
jgi:hypothetical protein